MRRLLWDFDGTLGFRDGGWSGALLETLARRWPDHTAAREDVRPFLRSGFPWQSPDVPHPHLRSAGAWWASVTPTFERAYVGLGVPGREAARLAGEVRAVYLDPARWRLYDETVAVLRDLASCGWTHRILSNHVPELEDLLGTLGILRWFDAVVTSAKSGYEKPHPKAFAAALGPGADRSRAWMIGDDPVADIEGAMRFGIRAVLVRARNDGLPHCCDDLTGVPSLVGRGGSPGSATDDAARGGTNGKRGPDLRHAAG